MTLWTFSACQRIVVQAPAATLAGSAQNCTTAPGGEVGVSVITGTTGITGVMQLTGVGPPPTGEGQPLTCGPQLTGVGPPPTGVGQPLPTGSQLTGVGPPPTGVGQPLTAGMQLTGVGPPPTGVGQPPTVVGVTAPPNVTRAESGALAVPSAPKVIAWMVY